MNTNHIPDFTWKERLNEFLLKFIWKFRKPLFLVLMGGPGAGKGTLSASLSPALNLAHVSTGNLLRAEVASGSEIGSRVEELMQSGKLVHDAITLYLLKKELIKLSNWRGAILDGYPRTNTQAQLLEQLLFSWDLGLPVVILIEVSEEDLIERLGGRLTCSNTECGLSYHVTFQPPKEEGICDSCGSELFRRPDDEPDSIRSRLVDFRTKTGNVLRFYNDYNRLYIIQSTNSGGKDDVLKQALEVIQSLPK